MVGIVHDSWPSWVMQMRHLVYKYSQIFALALSLCLWWWLRWPSATPNSVILPHNRADSGRFVMVWYLVGDTCLLDWHTYTLWSCTCDITWECICIFQWYWIHCLPIDIKWLSYSRSMILRVLLCNWPNIFIGYHPMYAIYHNTCWMMIGWYCIGLT